MLAILLFSAVIGNSAYAAPVVIARPERMLDLPQLADMSGVGALGLGLIPGLVGLAITETRADRRWVEQREFLLPLAEDPQVHALVEQFSRDLDALMTLKGEGPTSQVVGEKQRQRAELAVAPQPVLNVVVFNEFMHSGCGRFGVVLTRGTGYMKKTRDIKRRPVEVYVARHDTARAIVSEWCLPGHSLDSMGPWWTATPVTTEVLLPNMRSAAAEVLRALQEEPQVPADDSRVGTHGRRADPYFVVAYHPGRTLMSNMDQTVLRWIPAGGLPEIACRNACGPLLRAQAAERKRLAAWKEAAPSPGN